MVSFDADDAGLVVSVSGRSRPAECFVSVFPKDLRQFIDTLFTSHGKSDVLESGTLLFLRRIQNARLTHDFETGSVSKGNEVRSETGSLVVVTGIRNSSEILHEEVSSLLNIIYK